jgi:hypothetical protein
MSTLFFRAVEREAVPKTLGIHRLCAPSRPAQDARLTTRLCRADQAFGVSLVSSGAEQPPPINQRRCDSCEIASQIDPRKAG